jgi:hypothetical protein
VKDGGVFSVLQKNAEAISVGIGQWKEDQQNAPD